MRINAGSKLTKRDVYEAAHIASQHGQDFHIEELAVSPRGAITFYGESYSGNYAVNRQGRSGARAATWTAWGWFIAELYRRDPQAKIGQYKNAADFRQQCQSLHDSRERYGFRTQRDPGRDISFLALVPDETAVDRFNARWERVSSPEAIQERAAERAEYEARYEAMMDRKRAEES